MAKIKQVAKYDGSSWGTPYDLGADAVNIDVVTDIDPKTGEETTDNLQDLMDDIQEDISDIQTDLNNKVDTDDIGNFDFTKTYLETTGNSANTTVSGISQNSDTSADITTNAQATSGETTVTLWNKFNRFVQRVNNKFTNYLTSSNFNNWASSVTGYDLNSTLPETSLQAQISAISNENSFKTYSSVTQIGLTSGEATVLNVYNALPNYSILIAPAEEFAEGEVPLVRGIFEMKKISSERCSIHFTEKEGYESYVMYQDNSTSLPSGYWRQFLLAENPYIYWGLADNNTGDPKSTYPRAYFSRTGGNGSWGLSVVYRSSSDANPVYSSLINSSGTRVYAYKSEIPTTASDVSAAPTSHSSTATTYGYGDATHYGHVRVINNLTSTAGNGDALAAGQGKVLNEKFSNYVPTTRTVNGKALSGNIVIGTYEGTAGTSGSTFTLSGGSTFLVFTTHASTYTLRTIWIVSSGDAQLIAMCPGNTTAPTLTVTMSGLKMTVKTNAGTVGVRVLPLS